MKGQTNRSITDHHVQRKLRKNMTDAESHLWQRLRGRQLAGCKFCRQHPFLDYVLHFVCLEKRLIVEVDGGQHLDSDQGRTRDRRLQDAGFQVLRFWNNEVLQELDAVVEVILAAVLRGAADDAPSPHRPSP